jgi:hypothetical protein
MRRNISFLSAVCILSFCSSALAITEHAPLPDPILQDCSTTPQEGVETHCHRCIGSRCTHYPPADFAALAQDSRTPWAEVPMWNQVTTLERLAKPRKKPLANSTVVNTN